MKSITCIKIKKGLIIMKNQYIGICKVGEKGQIVIPKPARDMFDIQAGDSVVVLCDKKKGIAILKADVMQGFADKILGQDKEDNQE
ncbi:MAG: AbrB/MazE/SpoVT family DNA-binding domain-containing protein [Oscillospiraceae bacterium]|nr:AbrB/MazE/SpoVT family DNA-binding domain-containing protein [Oscillospiraceae bacterium]